MVLRLRGDGGGCGSSSGVAVPQLPKLTICIFDKKLVVPLEQSLTVLQLKQRIVDNYPAVKLKSIQLYMGDNELKPDEQPLGAFNITGSATINMRAPKIYLSS